MSGPERFQRLSESEFAHEEATLEYLFTNLPDRDPYWAWSNFTFIDEHQERHEVDLLLVTPLGIYLTELKTRSCDMSFAPGSWVEHRNHADISVSSPIALTERKAKRFAGLLQRTQAYRGRRVPYIRPLVIFTPRYSTQKLHVFGDRVRNLLIHDAFIGDNSQLAGAIEILSQSDTHSPDVQAHLQTNYSRIRREDLKPLRRAFEELLEGPDRHILDSTPTSKVGDYELGDLLEENESYQDFVAVDSKHYQVRARIYRRGPTTLTRDQAFAARDREYQLLRELSHPNILSHQGTYDDSSRGPVLLLQHPEASPLTEWLQGTPDPKTRDRIIPSFDERWHVLNHILDGIEYAHSKRIFHRALNPNAILVEELDRNTPHAYIYNWMTGQGDLHTTTVSMTQFIDQWKRYHDDIYQPLRENLSHNPALLDIFNLGLLGIYILTGTPPARSLAERNEKLQRDGGIKSSLIGSELPEALDSVFFRATRTLPVERYASIKEFRDALNKALPTSHSDARTSLRAYDQPASITQLDLGNVITASGALHFGTPTSLNGDTIRFVVNSVLGKGSTARAYLCHDQNEKKQVVLKVGLKPEYNARLDAEAQALQKLDKTPGIVRLYEVLTIADHRVLSLENAHETLRDKIREPEPPQIREIQAVGEQLFDILQQLEQKFILHRDIKPENIGVVPQGKNGEFALKLFDFSLASIPDTELEIGTAPYRDKMLRTNGGDARRKWDWHAEQWSVVTTLYEFVTHGQLPRWNGGGDPTVISNPTLEFDYSALPFNHRDGLITFFEKALRLDLRERFESIQHMQSEWRAIFEQTATEHSQDALYHHFTTHNDSDPLSVLSLATDLLQILEKQHIRTLGDLFTNAYANFVKTSSNLRTKLSETDYNQFLQLNRLIPRIESERASAHTTDARDYSNRDIDWLADHLWGSGAASAEEREWIKAELYDDIELSKQGLTRAQYTPFGGKGHHSNNPLKLAELREEYAGKWNRKKTIRPFRSEMAEVVRSAGGLIPFRTVVHAMRARRGTADSLMLEPDAPIRISLALCRAAFAAEIFHRDKTEFLDVPTENGNFLYDAQRWTPEDAAEFAVWLQALGERAEALVSDDRPINEARAISDLRAVPITSDVVAEVAEKISNKTLLSLAAEASNSAVLSTRNELYPEQMPALQVIKYGFQSTRFSRLNEVKLEAIKMAATDAANIFPQAQSLPSRDDRLIQLIQDADIGLHRLNDHSTSMTMALQSRDGYTYARSSTRIHETASNTYDALNAQLQHRRAEGGALVLRATDRSIEPVATGLASTYQLELVDAEALLFDALRAYADTQSVDQKKMWNVFMMHGDPNTTAFLNVLKAAKPHLEQALNALPAHTLFYRTSVLHRFGFTSLLEQHLQRLGSTDPDRRLWVLEPRKPSGDIAKSIGLRTIIPDIEIHRNWAPASTV